MAAFACAAPAVARAAAAPASAGTITRGVRVLVMYPNPTESSPLGTSNMPVSCPLGHLPEDAQVAPGLGGWLGWRGWGGSGGWDRTGARRGLHTAWRICMLVWDWGGVRRHPTIMLGGGGVVYVYTGASKNLRLRS